MRTLREMRGKVDVLITKLQNSSMLEDARGGGVKVHDMLREFGLWITSHNAATFNKYDQLHYPKFIARKAIANASEWSEATKISLYSAESLPELSDHCPHLHTLMIFMETDIDLNIEEEELLFLKHVPALNILDLRRHGGIRVLPPSISHLVHLRFLSLQDCRFQELPPDVGMLVQLVFIDLSECIELKELPLEMEALKKLRHLNVSHCIKLRIPSGLLSSLHKLEEMEAENSRLIFNNDNIVELCRLTQLTSINICLRGVTVASHWWKQLVKCISHLELRSCDTEPSVYSGFLEVSPGSHRPICSGMIPLRQPLAIGSSSCLFSNLVHMEINECNKLKVLFTNGVAPLLLKLQELVVYRCSQLEYLMVEDDDNLEIINAFPSLKKIELCELPELTAICTTTSSNHNQRTFDLMKWSSDLHEAIVVECPKLRRPPFGAQRADILLRGNSGREFRWENLKMLSRKHRQFRRQSIKRNKEGEEDDEELQLRHRHSKYERVAKVLEEVDYEEEDDEE